MGYTHYFYRSTNLNTKKFEAASADCRRVVESLGIPIAYEFDDIAAPHFGSSEVRFNGIGENGHETFHLLRDYNPEAWERVFPNGWFSFCKTAHKPYDAAVCACLIVFAHHFGKDFTVKSDGDDSDEGWKRAREACQAILSYGENFSLDKEDRS